MLNYGSEPKTYGREYSGLMFRCGHTGRRTVVFVYHSKIAVEMLADINLDRAVRTCPEIL